MMGVSYRYVSSQEEAKDILQDAFIKVFGRIDSFKKEGSLEGWIRRIMVNTAIDQIRKNKRDPFSIEDDARIQNLEEEIPFDVEETNMETSIQAEKAIKAISQLSPAYKTVFNLYVIEGYTHKEIAEYLGVSEGTSKSNLAKAKQKLRTILS
jgi:RNA polymerase sigma-70 factor (ECF subfamily)